MNFHKREAIVLLVVVGGLWAFGEKVVKAIGLLYRFALTPPGLAALVLATMLLSLATLTVVLIRRT